MPTIIENRRNLHQIPEIELTTQKTAQYIENKLRWNLAYTDLLAVRLAYEYAAAHDLDALMHLETVMAASRLPMEQREYIVLRLLHRARYPFECMFPVP